MNLIDKLSAPAALRLARKRLAATVKNAATTYKHKVAVYERLGKALDNAEDLLKMVKEGRRAAAASMNGVAKPRAKAVSTKPAAPSASSSASDNYLDKVLADGKTVKREDVLKGLHDKFGYKGVKAAQVLRRYREDGEKNRGFSLVFDPKEGTLTKGYPRGGKKTKATRKAKKVSAKKAAAPLNGKAARAITALVRRTVADSKEDVTRNKLVEFLSTKHKIDPDRTRAAILHEKKLGGIKEEGGVLTLV